MKLFTKHLSKNRYAILNSRLKNLKLNIKKLNDKNLKIIFFGKTNVLLETKSKSFALRINNIF